MDKKSQAYSLKKSQAHNLNKSRSYSPNKSRPYRLRSWQRAYLPFKRAADLLLSSLAIVLLALPLGIIALLISLDSRGPVFFRQKRVGKDGSYFEILKFRTMRTDTPKDVPTHLLEDPDRYITRVGRFLRKTSLDELPQIFNIFRGDMSVIGNRVILGTTGKISDFSRVCGY